MILDAVSACPATVLRATTPANSRLLFTRACGTIISTERPGGFHPTPAGFPDGLNTDVRPGCLALDYGYVAESLDTSPPGILVSWANLIVTISSILTHSLDRRENRLTVPLRVGRSSLPSRPPDFAHLPQDVLNNVHTSSVKLFALPS